eukprot:g6764.t1
MWGSFFAVLMVPVLIFLVYKRVTRRYNMQALTMVAMLDEKEGALYFDAETDKERLDLLNDLRCGAALDKHSFGSQARHAIAMLPDHTARVQFLAQPGPERKRIHGELVARLNANLRVVQEGTAAALSSSLGGHDTARERDRMRAEHNEGRPIGEGTHDAAREQERIRTEHNEGRPMGEGVGGAPGEGSGTDSTAPAQVDGGSLQGADGGRGEFRALLEQTKVMYSFLQVTTMWDQYSFPWPQEFVDFVRSLAFINFSFLDYHSIACATRPQFADKFVVMTFFPIFIAAFLLGGNRICRQLKMAKSSLGNTTLVLQAVFLLFFVIFPTTCSTTFRMLHCDEMADGSKWLVAQYDIACTAGAPVKTWLFGDARTYGFYKGLAIVMILVYPVGVPLFVSVLMYRMRDQLFEPLDAQSVILRDHDNNIVRTPHHRTSKYLGSLYVAYSAKYYWWEVVELVRKVLLTGVILFVRPCCSTQLVFGCLVAMIFTLSYAEFHPYLYKEDDTLQLLCQLAIFCTMFSGLLIKTGTAASDGYNQRVFSLILVVLNVVPVVIAASRVGMIFYTVGKRIGGKRFVIKHLMAKGEVKRVLTRTPTFQEVDKAGKLVLRKRSSRIWSSSKRSVTSIDKLEKELARLDAPAPATDVTYSVTITSDRIGIVLEGHGPHYVRAVLEGGGAAEKGVAWAVAAARGEEDESEDEEEDEVEGGGEVEGEDEHEDEDEDEKEDEAEGQDEDKDEAEHARPAA